MVNLEDQLLLLEAQEEVAEDPEAQEEEVAEDPEAREEEVAEDPEAREEENTSTDIGKIFELKRIYERLILLNNQLSVSADNEIIWLTTKIGYSIDLFETFIKNFEKFKDRIDEIIVIFYKLILSVYKFLDEHLKLDEEKWNAKS